MTPQKKNTNGFRKLTAEELEQVGGGTIVVTGNREIVVTAERPSLNIGFSSGGGGSSGSTGFGGFGFISGSGLTQAVDADGDGEDTGAICIGAGADGVVGQVCGAGDGDSAVRVGVGVPGPQVDFETRESISGLDINSTNIMFGVTPGDVRGTYDYITNDLLNHFSGVFDTFTKGFANQVGLDRVGQTNPQLEF